MKIALFVVILSFVVFPLVAEPFFVVTYNANTSLKLLSTPIDTKGYNAGDLVTVLSNPGEVLIGNEHGFPGLKFVGWNLCLCGKKTNYMPGDTFIMPDHNVTLYANWFSLAKPGVLYGTNK